MTKIPIQLSPIEQANVKTVIIIQPFGCKPATPKIIVAYCEYHRCNEPCTLLIVKSHLRATGVSVRLDSHCLQQTGRANIHVNEYAHSDMKIMKPSVFKQNMRLFYRNSKYSFCRAMLRSRMQDPEQGRF